jgi:hypothetical protein
VKWFENYLKIVAYKKTKPPESFLKGDILKKFETRSSFFKWHFADTSFMDGGVL